MICDRAQVERLLAELTGLRGHVSNAGQSRALGGFRPDLLVELPQTTLVVQCKGDATTEAVGAALYQLTHYVRELPLPATPLLVVPHMGAVGRRLCQAADANWMDLSGNAHIDVPGLRVRVQGQPNRQPRRGRPRNVFAPRASRITHSLLLHAKEGLTQEELVRNAGLSKSYVSTTASRLLAAGLVAKASNGRLRPRDPAVLLDTWREAYGFEAHRVIRGQVAVRSTREVVQRIAASVRGRYALTGLAAAWRYAPFATFRTVTVYLPALPDSSVLSEIGFREGANAGNLWLVIPKDEGVFLGTEERDRVCCASPVQTYLDLKNQPERAEEAAEALRERLLDGWTG